jgi:hypothetical protein
MELSPSTWTIIHRIYDSVNALLWAFGIVMVGSLILSIPRILEARTVAQYYQAEEISNESKMYCSKWGMPVGTDRYLQCEDDLQKIRAREAQRIADGFTF